MTSTHSSSSDDEMAEGVVVEESALRVPLRRGTSMIQSFSAPSPQTGSSSGSTPSAMHRPRPIYDAITLQDNDDESSKPSTIASARVHLWVADRNRVVGPERKSRVFCQASVQWPHMTDAEGHLSSRDYGGSSFGSGSSSRTSHDKTRCSQPEEIDIWLPRAQGSPSPIVRKVFVDGSPAGYTQNDAGDSLCLHVRRPSEVTFPLDERSRLHVAGARDEPQAERTNGGGVRSQSCGFLDLLVEYPAVTWATEDTADRAQASLEKRSSTSLSALSSRWLYGKRQDLAPTPPSTLQTPLPIFSSDILSLSVVLHGVPPGINILANDYDVVEEEGQPSADATSHSTAVARLQKFTVSSLTPLGILLVSQPARFAAPQAQTPPKSSPYSITLIILVALLAVILQNQLQAQGQLQGQVQELHRRVDQLAMATNVDFRDGTWSPDLLNGSTEIRPFNTRLAPRDYTVIDTLYQHTPANIALQHYQPHNAVEVHSLPVTLFHWIAIRPLLAVQRSVEAVYRFITGG